jgi:membrane carboxypeptidase/penicillin-binding protein PbpC
VEGNLISLMTDPKSDNPPIPRPRRRRRCRLVLLSLVLLTGATLPWLTFQAAVAWWPYPAGLDTPRQTSTWVQDRRGAPLAAFVADDGQWYLPLLQDQVSPHLLKALVAAEDARFYQHHGVDWPAVAQSAWEDVKALGIRRGASTITMQVQRLREPRPRGFLAKFEQAVRACQLEKQLPAQDAKARVLLEYVNRAPFGGNLTGAGAASWRYFGRACNDLSLGQAALLAGLPQSPIRLRPDRYPDRARRRRDYVLGRMLATGVITREQYQQAIAEPLDAQWRPLPQDTTAAAPASEPAAPGPTVFGSMPTLKWLTESHPGAVLRTTLDSDIQSQAYDASKQQLDALGPSAVTAAAVVVLDTQTGQCLAAVSLSRDAKGVDLTRSPRSTGSTLKPFIYAAAFDDSLATPATILHDTPAAWAGYVPGNFDGSFRGDIPAADALAESRNIPALQLLSRVGVERAAGLMGRLGLARIGKSPQRYGLSLAVGGAEASPIQLAQAYAALGRGGMPAEVSFVLRNELPASLSPFPGVPLVITHALHTSPWASTAGAAPDSRRLTPSPGTPGEVRGGRGEGAFVASPSKDPHPSPLPEYREREQEQMPASSLSNDKGAPAEAVGDIGPSLQSPEAPVFSTSACWQTLAALSDSSRTQAISRDAARVNAAWKTGTSSGRRDAWCAAVTRSHTVVVWMGNPSGKGAEPLVGSEAAAPLALKLIASLDHQEHPAPWLTGDAAAPTAGEPAVIAAPLDRRVTLLSPADGSQIVIDADQAADRQKVLLRAVPADQKQPHLWWFVNGSPVGETDGDQPLFWAPEPGAHEVRVVDAEGRSATARVNVR